MKKIPMPEEVRSVTVREKAAPVAQKVTVKQAKYDLERMTNPNGPQTLAAKNAGYSMVPGAKASKLEKASKLRIETAMDNVGLTTTFLARRIKEGCHAKRSVTEMVGGKEVTREVPDHAVRTRYMTLACKLRGLLDKKIKIEEDSTRRFEFSANMSLEEKRAMLQELESGKEIPANYEVGGQAPC